MSVKESLLYRDAFLSVLADLADSLSSCRMPFATNDPVRCECEE